MKFAYPFTVAICLLATAGVGAEPPAPVATIQPSEAGYYRETVVTPDGTTLVAVTIERTITLFDLATGKQKPLGYGRPINNSVKVAFTPDGKVVAVTGWGGPDANLYTFPKKEHLRGYQVPGVEQMIRFTSDGKRFVAFGAQSVKCWEWDNGPDGKRLYEIKAPVGFAGCDLSPDGKWIAYLAGDKTGDNFNGAVFKITGLAIADASTGDVKKLIPVDKTGLGLAPQSLAFTKDGKTLVLGGAGVRMWDWENGKELAKFPVGGRVSVSPDGKYVAYFTNGNFGLIDLEAKKWVGSVSAEASRSISALTFTPDSKRLISAHMGTKVDDIGSFKVWELEKLVTDLAPKKK